MSVQIILCMETKKSAATDYVYIRGTLDRFYDINNKVKITPIYMNSKSRYNSNQVEKQIKSFTKDFSAGKTHVIYCIDTDWYEVSVDRENELKRVENYCEDNGYDLIWFCHDVEEVYLGRSISDNQKVKAAANFRNQKKIQEVSEKQLSSQSIKKRTSNIMAVLDNYLRRK